MDLMSLPVVMIENILSYLSYDEIAKNRILSRAFNEICMKMLNRGFLMIERRHAHALKNVKAQLPRRESERRYHGLSRHCDILTSIETRISMLNMTYSKFIDLGLCCFIPGKVIDEIRRVLRIVETESTPPRAHEVLQELRDISSMAIEHFDDKISPAFRRKLQEGAQPPPRPPQAVLAPFVFRQEMQYIRRRTSLNAKLSLFLATQYRKCTRRMLEYRKLTSQQNSTIKRMFKRQREQDATIADLKKRIEECDIKYSELTHTNQAAGGASKSEVGSGQSLRHFSSQIKLDLSELPIGTSRTNSKSLQNIQPRKPVIRLPSLSESEGEPPKKMAKIDEPAPSTPPKTKLMSTMAKLKSFTNEIKHLDVLSKNFDDMTKNWDTLTKDSENRDVTKDLEKNEVAERKRPILCADIAVECKKVKKD